MSTPLTPQVAPTSAAPSAANRPNRGRALTTAFVVCGIAIAVVGVTGAAANAARTTGESSQNLSADAAGLTDLTINASTGSLEVIFADVPEAMLNVTKSASGPEGKWTLEREGNSLRIGQETGWWMISFGWNNSSEQTAVLTLPNELNEKLNLDFDYNAGDALIDGDFATAAVTLNAGDVRFTGKVDDFVGNVNAGDLTLDIVDVSTLDVQINAGGVTGSVTGTPPLTSRFVVAAGDINLFMPDDAYRIDEEVNFGDSTITLDTASTSQYVIAVEVNAGDITLKPGK